MPRPSTAANPLPTPEIPSGDRIFIIMGRTGAGKSTFIKYATQQDEQTIGHSLLSCTSDIRTVGCVHPHDGKPVILVDTPGFDDMHKSDLDILSLIASWLGKAYKKHIPLSIIYLHRISDNRVAGSPLKNLQVLAEMCRLPAFPRVVIATTMWGEVNEGTAVQREKELGDLLWKDMIENGCTVERFADSYESAWNILSDPLKESNVALRMDMVDDKKHMGEPGSDISLPPETLSQLPRSSSPHANISERDRIIILMGPTGAGRSTFIEYATRQGEQTIGHSLHSCTSDIRAVRCNHPSDGKPVIFVDTPGFDDRHESNIAILSLIAGWLVKIYQKDLPLTTIVYLHRISDNRMAGLPLKNIQIFSAMCGQLTTPPVVIGTTMWSEVKDETGMRRQAELQATWKGCQFHRFEDSHKSAWELLESATSLPHVPPLVLSLHAISSSVRAEQSPRSRLPFGRRIRQFFVGGNRSRMARRIHGKGSRTLYVH